MMAMDERPMNSPRISSLGDMQNQKLSEPAPAVSLPRVLVSAQTGFRSNTLKQASAQTGIRSVSCQRPGKVLATDLTHGNSDTEPSPVDALDPALWK